MRGAAIHPASDRTAPQQQNSIQPQITAARLRKPAVMEYAKTYSVATTRDSDGDGNPKEGMINSQGVGACWKRIRRGGASSV